MTLFVESTNTQAKLKAGFLGFQGAGKTYTATRLMIGLIQYMRKLGLPEANRPLYFLDTETGSDWVRPLLEKEGIKLMSFKSRAFKDLIPAVREAEENGSGLIVDSVSHFWKEFTEAYMRKKNRSRLEFQDWNFLKPEWGKFTDAYVNSNLHMTICGRAGFEYDYFEDDNGKKQLEKTGIKMKAENEFGYEPSLLVLMERAVSMEDKHVHREAHILKDRAALLDGKTLKFGPGDEPGAVFNAFLPHIEFLNLSGKQLGVDLSRTSDSMIESGEGAQKSTWKYEQEQKEIVLEKIQALFVQHGLSGQSKDGKAEIVRLIKKHFDTTSWKEIEGFRLETVKKGFDTLSADMSGETPTTQPAGPAEDSLFEATKKHLALVTNQGGLDLLLDDMAELTDAHKAELAPLVEAARKRVKADKVAA